MVWKPNKFVAALLGLFVQFLGMLYVARIKWALFYFLAAISVLAVEMYLSAPWLRSISIVNIISIICAIHAYRIADNYAPMEERPWFTRWYSLGGIYTLTMAAVFSFRAFLYEPFHMPSGSMLPTIKIGSYVLVEKYGYGNYGAFGVKVAWDNITKTPLRGDLIAFEYPVDKKVIYVKRVIGVPGDTVVFKGNKLTVNGNPIRTVDVDGFKYTVNGKEYNYQVKQESLGDTSYQVQYLEEIPPSDFSVVLPPENYFLLGDNRDNSRDSRYWGFVPQANVVGKVVYITQ